MFAKSNTSISNKLSDKLSILRQVAILLNEAVAAYLEMYQWQTEEIKNSISEADAGDFASDEEVKATFARLTNAD